MLAVTRLASEWDRMESADDWAETLSFDSFFHKTSEVLQCIASGKQSDRFGQLN